jgi:Prokaryotic N-terminal methylation motif
MSAPRRISTSGRPRASRRGFTLLEVVLAMGILLLGLSVVLGLLSFGAALARTSAMRTTSAQAVEAVMADLEETLFELEKSGEAAAPVAIVERALPGDAQIVYTATPTLLPLQPDAVVEEYHVVVELGWLASGVRKSARFETVFPRQVPFGERQRARTNSER